MAIVLALLWEKGPDRFSYLVFDESAGGTRHLPIETTLTMQNCATEIGKIFTFAQQQGVTEIEHRILGHGNPAGSTHQPHALSVHVQSTVQNAAQIHGFTMRQQQRSKLSGDPLKKFKSGLQHWGMISAGRGNAWQAHLWAVAWHATAGTHKKLLKDFWSAATGVSTLTRAGKTQFAAWYASL